MTLAHVDAPRYAASMTLTEAAERLGLSTVTLRVQIGREKLRATKHGRDWWVTEAEIERYRAASKGKHQPKAADG